MKLLMTALILGVAAAPAVAEDRMNACEMYQIENALGSFMASGHKQVCDHIGPQLLTNACMTYYTRLTSRNFPPSKEALAKLAAECEATMPGGASLQTCAEGANCPAIGDIAVSSGSAEPMVDVLPPGDMPECGTGLECRPEPDDLAVPLTDDDAPAPAAAQGAADAALDLAFWEAIKETNDPNLYRAYLAQFPNGTFRVIVEARLQALPTAPAAAPAAPVATPAAPAANAEAIFDQAEAIMSAAYALDVTRWDAEARRAMPLYTQAGQGGFAPAWVELASLYENGIGTAQDNQAALELYQRAGAMGYDEGYYRALMVADQLGESDAYVQSFLALYRSEPGMALDSFNSVSSAGPRWLQQFLQAEGVYTGQIDGAFGAGSHAALETYLAASALGQATSAQPDDSNLALALQRELQRVGCYLGALDGRWGGGSIRALEAFNIWEGGITAAAKPTEAALAAVRDARGLVCGVD
ncbi:hypothetical protein [Phaeovulum sp.]|uniref:hypothetical protein n=1 Tax=Phaeovulum sp. TaxID=2934796 RepID=UPI003567309A